MPVRTIDAHFTLTTPAFVGGAGDGSAKPAFLRVPTIMGLVRFWWRALAWREVAAMPDPIAELGRGEARLFGAAARDDGTGGRSGGQGAVLARLVDGPAQRSFPTVGPADRTFAYGAETKEGLAYLAGQGLKGRGSLPAGEEFTLRLICRPKASEHDLEQIIRAIRCLGLVGGIGARNRRGFGSLALRKIVDSAGKHEWLGPRCVEEYRNDLETLLAGHRANVDVPFTAFSNVTQLWLAKAPANSDVADWHEAQGFSFQYFRSKGLGGMLGGKAARSILPGDPIYPDIDWFDQIAMSPPTLLPRAPVRAVFGLPHNYRSGTRRFQKLNNRGRPIMRNGEPVMVNHQAAVTAVVPAAATGGAKSDRRASPLFLHLHQMTDPSTNQEEIAAVWLLMPAVFLPPATGNGPGQVEIKPNNMASGKRNFSPNWSIVYEFFQSLATRHDATRIIP
ncbi:MAG: hypothetical protein KDE35_18240 [Geminicoccaceae bacterium]|nr:hypothetical protein [Geminicoccaceae bacterium]